MQTIPGTIGHECMGPDIADSLAAADAAAFAVHVERQQHCNSVAAGWLETVAVQTDLRQVLIDQRAAVARIGSYEMSGHLTERQCLDGFTNGFAERLDLLDIVLPEEMTARELQSLRQRRIARLHGRISQSLVNILGDAVMRPIDRLPSAESIIMDGIRNFAHLVKHVNHYGLPALPQVDASLTHQIYDVMRIGANPASNK